MGKENTLRDVFGYIQVSNGCWEWQGNKDMEGYGRISWKSKMTKAHRLIYELFEMPIPEGLCVLHKCDNPGCVNPDHLFTGTNYDNIADRNAKGRTGSMPGSKHPFSKLNEADVFEIRRLWETGDVKQKVLARVFDVTSNNISLIVTRKSWAHI